MPASSAFQLRSLMKGALDAGEAALEPLVGGDTLASPRSDEHVVHRRECPDGWIRHRQGGQSAQFAPNDVVREVIHVLQTRQETRGVYKRIGDVPGHSCRSRMGLIAMSVKGVGCERSAEGLTLDLLAGDKESKEDEALRMRWSGHTLEGGGRGRDVREAWWRGS